ncbi:MAG: hypothetical protein J6H18_03975 [Lachnospiraceae bacterium]|nr:hypothetical protein [Lachnospiraceae bacterium]
MGRRVQRFDTIANGIYVAVSLLMLVAALLCLIQGTLKYVYLIAAGGVLYYLTAAISEFVRREDGFVKRGIIKLIITLLLCLFTYVAKVCL